MNNMVTHNYMPAQDTSTYEKLKARKRLDNSQIKQLKNLIRYYESTKNMKTKSHFHQYAKKHIDLIDEQGYNLDNNTYGLNWGIYQGRPIEEVK